MKIPDVYALLLYLLDLNDGRFEGKTNIHKNVYLLQQMLPKMDFPVKFRPYFYGPYSEDVSEALNLLHNVGLMTVTQVDLGMRDAFEVRKCTYRLTPAGEEAVKAVRKSYRAFADELEDRFNTLKATGYHENTKVLSTAAKVNHILSTEHRPLNKNTIRAKAKELGWEIGSGDLAASVKVLVDIGLARMTARKG